MKRFVLLITSLMLVFCVPALADDVDVEPDGVKTIPDEVKPFIPKDMYPIYINHVDLNGDQRPEYLIVAEKNNRESKDTTDQDESPRPLIILKQDKDGQFIKAKENNKVVYCKQCGGVFGDPFQGIQITKKGFIVNLYGGSGWRWSTDYEFTYSRIDKTWQLIRAYTADYHVSDPDHVEEKTYKPPKDFGKIDLADFDPDTYREETKEDK